MICTAKIENGIIRLPPEMDLPDGTEVQISAPDPAPEAGVKSFAERYAKYIGDIEGLPPDLAENVDHYVHGRGIPS